MSDRRPWDIPNTTAEPVVAYFGGKFGPARRPARGQVDTGLPSPRWSKAVLVLVAALAVLVIAHGLPSEAHAAQSTVTVGKSPSDGGTVTGEGIDCGTDCSESFDARETCEGGDEISPGYCYDYWGTDLTATPAYRYAFDHWEDCPGPSGRHCHAWLAEGEARTVTAHFRLAECSDGKNNDSSDDKVDHPDDPDCESPSDDTEATTPPPLTVTPQHIGATNDATPTVEFSSTESGVRFRCLVSVDQPFPGSEYTAYFEDNCTSPFTTRRLPEGNAVISVTARDAKGHESSERRTLAVDTTVPDTSLRAAPQPIERLRDAWFDLSSSEWPHSYFECRLDRSSWSRCTSPETYSNLSQGTHTFEGRAIDAAGNRDATPVIHTWKVDTVAPRVTSVNPGSGATGVSPAANVLATLSEAMRAGTVTRTTVKLVRKGMTTPVAATVTYDASRRRATLNPRSALARGATYTATVTRGAKDLAGNPLARAKAWSFRVRR